MESTTSEQQRGATCAQVALIANEALDARRKNCCSTESSSLVQQRHTPVPAAIYAVEYSRVQ